MTHIIRLLGAISPSNLTLSRSLYATQSLRVDEDHDQGTDYATSLVHMLMDEYHSAISKVLRTPSNNSRDNLAANYMMTTPADHLIWATQGTCVDGKVARKAADWKKNTMMSGRMLDNLPCCLRSARCTNHQLEPQSSAPIRQLTFRPIQNILFSICVTNPTKSADMGRHNWTPMLSDNTDGTRKSSFISIISPAVSYLSCDIPYFSYCLLRILSTLPSSFFAVPGVLFPCTRSTLSARSCPFPKFVAVAAPGAIPA